MNNSWFVGLTLVSLTALLIAAKMEESDNGCPSLSHFLDISGREFTVAEVQLMEVSILQNWDWNGEYDPVPGNNSKLDIFTRKK